MAEHFRTAAVGIAREIDRNIDFETGEKAGDTAVAHRARVVDLVEGLRQTPLQIAIVAVERDSDYLEMGAIVPLDQFDDETRHRMVAKIRRAVGDPYPVMTERSTLP